MVASHAAGTRRPGPGFKLMPQPIASIKARPPRAGPAFLDARKPPMPDGDHAEGSEHPEYLRLLRLRTGP